MSGRSIVAAAIIALAISPASCKSPPSRQETGGAGTGGRLDRSVFQGDHVVEYLTTWAPGRSVKVQVEVEDGKRETTVTSTWRKSSLMPSMQWRIQLTPEARKDLEDVLLDMEMTPSAQDDPLLDSECYARVTAAGTRWENAGDCESMDAKAWASLSGLFHPRWFSASHLLAAGIDAEPKMDARDVYHYYLDGIAILGDTYGPVQGDITGEQLERAASAYEQEQWVDAVVQARNALQARITLYEKLRLPDLSPTPMNEASAAS